jgi:hypothetical protein
MSDAEVLDEETTSEEVEDTSLIDDTEVDEEYSEYKFKFEGKDVSMSPEEFERFYKDYNAEQKWQQKHHERGRQLNQERQDLERQRAEIEAVKQNAKEWEDIKKQLNQSPEGRKLIAQYLNQARPTVDPVIEEQQNEIQKLRIEFAKDKAVAALSKQLPDFDADELEQFAGDFNFRDQKDMMLFTYYARKGSQVDDLVSEAKANVVREAKKKKGLPATGKKATLSKNEPKNIDEARAAALEAIKRGEPLY